MPCVVTYPAAGLLTTAKRDPTGSFSTKLSLSLEVVWGGEGRGAPAPSPCCASFTALICSIVWTSSTLAYSAPD